MESGLLGLRAEVQKKRTEAGKLNVDVKGKRSNKSFLSCNAGVSDRAAKDKQQLDQETVTPQKARTILEEKAALYEKLNSGVEVLEDDNLNQKFLINFQKKIVTEVLEKKEKSEEERKEKQRKREEIHPDDYTSAEARDEWVEYVDAFGRTRECMRRDLPNMLHKDSQLKKDLGQVDESEEDEAGAGGKGSQDTLLEELFQDSFRQRWAQQEALNATKKDIHYQDVLFDEARAHGPGFMKFSRDEKQRQEQMEFLQEMRAETKAGATARASSEAKKKAAMKARLDKVRQRKRLKIGLPIKEDDRLKTPPASDEEDEAQIDSKSGIPVPDTGNTEPRPVKSMKVREWDLGKEEQNLTLGRASGIWGAGNSGLKRLGRPTRSSPLSQEEWVDKQRTERKQEFAPPSAYQPQYTNRFRP
ncbi:hypothetical protein Pcinc_017949 [Petrolisthes cinctipes]|uniref:CCDC174 alpha/beta GRSR domain-containing protein n=1 Tax=Petrolisthes cinctipes TaxID=88211 RepID=A0AAE1KJW6_PETCI|nr:hypothetical protein Pcinc_017949 [Petrolisthes cinctipes]